MLSSPIDIASISIWLLAGPRIARAEKSGRIGAVRGVETLDRVAAGDASALPLLTDLCTTMKAGSLCALGGFTPYPVMSAVTHFPDDFARAREAAE